MKPLFLILSCATLISGCASVRPLTPPTDLFACPVPQAYPENPDANALIEALNDTYLAWETCRDSLRACQTLSPVQP